MPECNDIGAFFHRMADEGDEMHKPPEDEFFSRMAAIKQGIIRRRDAAYEKQVIDLQRDRLIARIADTLGICRGAFRDFFDHIQPLPDE